MAAAMGAGARAVVASRRRGRLHFLALALLASCGEGGGAAPPSAPVAPAAARSVVLVSLDTLRADHLGCYGYARETSPAIDSLAQRGALFEEDVSSSSWTVPAHMSMLTGLYPRSHGVDEHGKRLAPQTTTLAEHL